VKHDLPIQKQAEVLRDQPQQRSTIEPRPVSEDDLWLMRRIDELHLELSVCWQPDAARTALATAGLEVGRRHIKT
jgi:putative transposase